MLEFHCEINKWSVIQLINWIWNGWTAFPNSMWIFFLALDVKLRRLNRIPLTYMYRYTRYSRMLWNWAKKIPSNWFVTFRIDFAHFTFSFKIETDDCALRVYVVYSLDIALYMPE